MVALAQPGHRSRFISGGKLRLIDDIGNGQCVNSADTCKWTPWAYKARWFIKMKTNAPNGVDAMRPTWLKEAGKLEREVPLFVHATWLTRDELAPECTARSCGPCITLARSLIVFVESSVASRKYWFLSKLEVNAYLLPCSVSNSAQLLRTIKRERWNSLSCF